MAWRNIPKGGIERNTNTKGNRTIKMFGMDLKRQWKWVRKARVYGKRQRGRPR